MKTVVITALQVYKRWISPMLPSGSCRFVPTCSEYAAEAVERYGVLRGAVMAAWRILRCNPLGGHGYDPVVSDSASYPQVAETTHCCSTSK